MKNPLQFIAMLTVALAAYMFTSCAKDGDPGPAGEQGEQGRPGENGEDGKDGEDGVGFEEATQYGNVAISLDGHRPDGKAFKKDLNFKFTPVGVNGINTSSVVDIEENAHIITIRRFYSTVAEGLQDNQITLNVHFSNDGGKPEITNVFFYLRTVITTDDFKFFFLDDYYEPYALTGEKEYTYDPATGQFSLKLNFDVPGDFEFNGTRHDLHVAATVNVKVFEKM
ncbi:collagen-like protein [Parachryseolinea silvisoli]|jgi:hypothetical protein|uniref:collagen-like protein n=1 Tax=Parachryseolinea silvisoli TaxID=2873601 RepID=UPI002265DB5C|nr:collagen-like protein [Parachryseolinea silvisoli]MCD9016938.1 collagen-like protein [Parachryseolinea silvisoli]